MTDATILPYSAAPLRQVKAIQLGVLSPTVIKATSVLQAQTINGKEVAAGVSLNETYDPITQQPVYGGLADERLGNIYNPEDPGQFGHLDLARPVYHVGFIGTVLLVLKCVGFHSHRLLKHRPEDQAAIAEAQKLHKLDRLRAMAAICSKLSQDVNGGAQPQYRRIGVRIQVDFTGRVSKWKKRANADEPLNDEDLEAQEDELLEGAMERGKRDLRASEALYILADLSDDDCRLLGFNPVFARPDWLIIQSLPIPPPHVRPSISMSSTQRCEDDITHLLATIVKTNKAVQFAVNRGEAVHAVDQYVLALQMNCAALIDNGLPYIPRAKQRSGKFLKTFKQRLVGKEGRVRGNLMGKRVDFTARSVITADPNLSIDQVGVPISIAKTLTVPERVTEYNLERMRALVTTGCEDHPGANYIVKGTVRKDLRYASASDIAVRVGDIVERHLDNDDVVLFNRQPSLHKMSIMGHRVRVLPWSTFRLNLSVTTPYNADFDGDEMNMHVPQSLAARTEAEQFMMVNKVIVSPQSNRPVMGIVQDALLSSSLMTRRDVFIGKEMLMNIMMWIEDWNGRPPFSMPRPAIMVPTPGRGGQYTPYWTGKQVFSLAVPLGVNMNHTRSNGHPDKESFADMTPLDTWVQIDNGQVLSGTMDKKTLGTGGGGLVHVVCNDRTPEVARVMFNNIQKVANYWILHRSFTVGVGDTVADKRTLETVYETLSQAKRDVAELVQKGQRGELEMTPGRTMQETFEDLVNVRLNAARDTAGQSAEASLTLTNSFKGTVAAGSKGSFLNIAQIMACVGQQNVDGKRIPYGFDRRTLPHFAKDDLGPESRGFVENSYLKGLSPQEFFFHAMGGRVGLIDTACKTAETGYIQRRLVKALEDVSARYDGTVRNGRGEIIQFLYGEDGMDAAFIESQNLPSLKMTASEMREAYRFDVDDPFFGQHKGFYFLEHSVIQEIRLNPDARRELDAEFNRLVEDQAVLRSIAYAREPGAARYSDRSLPLPVNVARMLLNTKKRFFVDETRPSDLKPMDVVRAVNALLDRLVVVAGDDALSREAQRNGTLVFGILVRSTLASKTVLSEHRLSKQAFEYLLGEIETRFNQSIVAPGEMCGVLAAQSIGEPATQMTLNTFHHAGVSNKKMTLGVPRLKEIINVSKNAKTPSLTVYLARDVRNDKVLAERLMNRIEYATLESFTETIEVVYDPFPANQLDEPGVEYTNVVDDAEWVAAYYEIPGDNFNPTLLGSFVLRLVLDRAQLAFKGITLEEIAAHISKKFDNSPLEVIHTDANADVAVMRLRVIKDGAAEAAHVQGEPDDRILIRLQKDMLAVKLRGVPGIPKVFIRKEMQQRWDNGFVSAEEWVLDTEGSNLEAIMAVEGVDHTRTTSNELLQTLAVLGIEGVRRAIFNELRAVISGDGSYVNYRHLATLVDVMTARGFIMAVTRHGVNRAESGPLMRASFEETVEILMEAAAFSEMDPLRGVSENIMLGKLAPIGTGSCKLLLDEELLAKHANDHVSASDEVERVVDLSAPQTPLGNGMSPSPTSPAYAFGGQGAFGGALTPMGDVLTSPMAGTPSSPLQIAMSAAASAAGGQQRGGGASGSLDAFRRSPQASPSYSSSSPAVGAYSPSSPGYNPSSPAYSPSSPAYAQGGVQASSPAYSPSSPAYSPSSPAYSPSSPAYAPGSGQASSPA